jgi:carboxymethylenebutenolidase
MNARVLRLASICAVVLFASLPSIGEPTTETFQSGGKTVHVEVFAPEGKGPHAAVLLLYGGGGMTIRPDDFRKMAADLAVHGYYTFIPHYFDRTGSDRMGEMNQANAQAWVSAVHDAVSFASGHSGVDGKRIGFVAFSLGAFVGLAEVVNDPRVKVISEYYGGLASDLPPDTRHMPPVLILHGEKDQLIPVDRAYEIQKFLNRIGTPNEIKVYPGVGHGFDSDNAADEKDAWQRTLAFLEKYLG